MADDPYAALGVEKTADAAAIKKAYRKIARTAHPDLNPDDPVAEARFKGAAAAYDLLKDAVTRARFDRGEIDADGTERAPRGYYRDTAGGPQDSYSRPGFDRTGFGSAGSGRARPGGGSSGDFDPEDIFAAFARARQGGGGDPFGGGRPQFDMPGQDRRYTLQVPFLDAARGAKTQITLPEGGTLVVVIPEGATDGLTLRLRGKGGPGHGGGAPGDAYVTLSVANDSVFTREGNDIRTRLDISIDEAILGAKVSAPTIDGDVRVTVPVGASSGRTLRLRGRGVKTRSGGRGDQLIELRVVLPPKIDDDLRRFMEGWRQTHGYEPRGGRT